VSSLREALEAALVENPDDLAAHMAYADHLHDQGDPRGELIQVQLALENGALVRSERERLAAREKVLLEVARPGCLGTPLGYLLGRMGVPRAGYRIRRGWLAEVEQQGTLGEPLAETLATAPEARLLRKLALEGMPERYRVGPGGLGRPSVVEILSTSSNFRNLRALHLNTLDGFARQQSAGAFQKRQRELFVAGDRVWDWVANLPRLEELYLGCRTQNVARLFALPTLGALRILQLNHGQDHPLDVLAGNPVLARLTHLSLFPRPVGSEGDSPCLHLGHLAAIASSPNLPGLTHLRFQRSDAGDAGVRLLLESGLLVRLSMLDLALGSITDEGANLLAEADLGDLEILDVSDNAISPAGQRTLGTALKRKLTLRMGEQHEPGDGGWLDWAEVELE
jgi:uncharacterized protein (TIGR02996 family)